MIILPQQNYSRKSNNLPNIQILILSKIVINKFYAIQIRKPINQ